MKRAGRAHHSRRVASPAGGASGGWGSQLKGGLRSFAVGLLLKVKGLAPLACKTDKVDARVLAELCRRDLVPTVWLPSLDDRALRERLKRRMQLVRMRTMARNRVHGVLSQWGLKLAATRLRQRDGLALLEARGVPEVWRRSVAEALAVIDCSTSGWRRWSASWGRWRTPTRAWRCSRRSPGSGRCWG